MKWYIIILLIVVLSFSVEGVMCKESPTPNMNCTMITPTINCTGNYLLFNESGVNFQNGSMTSIGNQLYTFQFNQSKGDYVIQLCDGTTREVYVGGVDNMGALIGIVLGLLGFLGIIIYIIHSLHQDHETIKGVLLIIVILIGIGLVNLCRLIAENYTNTAISSFMDTIYTMSTWLFYLFIGYVFIFYLYKLLMWFNERIIKGIKKEDK